MSLTTMFYNNIRHLSNSLLRKLVQKLITLGAMKRMLINITKVHCLMIELLQPIWVLGDRVFIQGAAATPLPLINAMAEHGKSAGLRNVEVVHIHTDGEAKYASKEYEGIEFEFQIYCCGIVNL